MPAVAQPAKWRFEVPAGAPHGQVVALTSGCGQCHGPILNGPRSHLGAHRRRLRVVQEPWSTTTPPRMPKHEERDARAAAGADLRMGNYSPTRMWESQLRDDL